MNDNKKMRKPAVSNSVKDNCKTQLRNERPEISKQDSDRRDGPGGN